MSDNPMLRWGFAHEQTPQTATYYVKNRFKRRQRARRVIVPVPGLPTVEQVAGTDNLIDIYFEMKRTAGKAPGPDGVTYNEMGRREVAEVMRVLSRAVLAGTYRPGPTRAVPIPKLKGGTRTLHIANLCDRVLAAALNRALEPLWESVFLPCSMGFRPGRGVWRMLAETELAMTRDDLWVLAQDDVRKAFDNVIINDVMADHARHINNAALLSLLGVVLRGGDGKKRTRGIDQGCPYSPTALNVRMHHALDLGATQGHHPFRYYRYADNLVWLCRSVPEGHQVIAHARQLLEPAGFTLKGEEGVQDLRQGQTAQLLGFTLSEQNGRLQFEPGQDSWTKLERDLARAHETADPAKTAHQVVSGWIGAHGPAFESWQVKPLDHILHIMAELGFRERLSRESLADQCETAWIRWSAFRERVGQTEQAVKQAGMR
jgi:hypothetical protein